MDVKVTWKGELEFEAATDKGASLTLGAPVPAGEPGGLLKPMDLIAVGLAGCTAMDVISILLKKRQEVSAFEVQAHFERSAEHPRVFTSAVLDYIVTGRGVDPAAVIRSMELSITRYCPAHAMLSQAVPFAFKYQVFEASDAGAPTLVSSGAYTPADAEMEK